MYISRQPYTISCVASVTINGCRENFATKKPLTQPTRPPTAMAIRITSQIDIAQLGPAQQISWHERTADILWHANQNTLAALYYRLLSTNDAIPEPAARRIEIKAQAAETMHSPVSQILRLWFANSLDESIAAASQAFSNAPIPALRRRPCKARSRRPKV